MAGIWRFIVPTLCMVVAREFGDVTQNLAVLRGGDGTVQSSNVAVPVFVDEWAPPANGTWSAAWTLVQSIPLLTSAVGGNASCTQGSTATSEGHATTSLNGQYFVTPCYGVAAGTASVTTLSGTSRPAVVARVDFLGNVDTTTQSTALASGDSLRGAASLDGSSYWVVGTSQMNFLTHGPGGSKTIMGTGHSYWGISPTSWGAMLLAGQSSTSCSTFVCALGSAANPYPNATTTGAIATVSIASTPLTSNANHAFAYNAATVFVCSQSHGLLQLTGSLTTWSVQRSWSTCTCNSVTARLEGDTVVAYITNAVASANRMFRVNTSETVCTAIATAATNTQFRAVAAVPSLLQPATVMPNVTQPATPSLTPSATSSWTRSSSNTGSVSQTPSPTYSSSSSGSHGASVSASPTDSGTVSATITSSESPSQSISQQTSASPSAAEAASQSATASRMPTLSPSASAQATPTPTASAQPTPPPYPGPLTCPHLHVPGAGNSTSTECARLPVVRTRVTPLAAVLSARAVGGPAGSLVGDVCASACMDASALPWGPHAIVCGPAGRWQPAVLVNATTGALLSPSAWSGHAGA
jgi:hypothetical protein